MGATLHLGRTVLDKGLITADGYRAGKVDDLLLEIDSDRPGAQPPVVCAIITGPMALAQEWPLPIRRLVHALYRVVGVHDPRPILIPWSEVHLIHAVLWIARNHDDGGLNQFADAIRRRFIDRIPGARAGRKA